MTDAAIPAPRTFKVMRNTDVSGVSGAGHVADGVLFGDGTTVLRWRSEHRSTAVYEDFETMRAIHGHDGATVFEFSELLYVDQYGRGVKIVDELDYQNVAFKNAVLKVVGDELGKRRLTAVTQLRSTH
jgi:hypothetical protein